ncbi:hypothetical protein AB6A40_008221 [Gnathostoma spinigerum]|uniref:Uncharacterized protein n=1 Tax=Gnathostoma spinigerum TaxID=75299 RepID=A0ABD6EXU2_9BILA
MFVKPRTFLVILMICFIVVGGTLATPIKLTSVHRNKRHAPNRNVDDSAEEHFRFRFRFNGNSNVEQMVQQPH